MRRLVRRLLALVLAASVALSLLTTARIALSPELSPWREATAAEIVAATDRMLLLGATPARIETLILARLSETPRNWPALAAIRALADERGIPLAPDTQAAYDAALATDESLMKQAGDCARCIWDITQCSLSKVLICRAPVDLTFVGDLAGVGRAAANYMAGADIDDIDLGLSLAGLAATATILVSGGTSATLKAGAGAAKVARGMGRLSDGVTGMVRTAVKSGVKWDALPSARSADDLYNALRWEAFAPLADTLGGIERIRAATGTTDALHLLPLVDSATDARRLGNAAEALGPRMVGRAEVLGKARIMRATLRATGAAWALVGGIIGMALSGAMLLIHALQSWAFRRLRRAASG
ncbi:hypothetical protein [Paragemmobacter straminiformis]|uniref:Uncharacterized protein n=1 Tax=Paragemmobacter straminiformis TaxID=2045119 RepID=A0A842IAC6_9RHOB|nr:hypothetical protein [Gemmobacter straminiformis]MBC2836363.1 hypothetical protein [Gemmobacter straminiformis]